MSNKDIRIETKKTDVLIVGGGVAGALAAIEAAKAGKEVIVLERANTYRSGSSGSGIDHLTSYVDPFHKAIGYTKQMMKDEYAQGPIEQGLGDRRITDHYVDVSYERMLRLEEYGVKLRGFEDSDLPEGFRMVPQFNNVPTSINFEGRDIKVKLTEGMIKEGVTIINHAQVVKILVDQNKKAAGAIAVSSIEDVVYEVLAKAVVLSVSAGAGSLSFPCNRVDAHYERPSASGSGAAISLSLSAGAEVANLEFGLNYGELSYMGFSTRVGSPGSSWWPAARAVDDDGEVLVKRIYKYPVDEPDYIEKHTKMWKEFMDEFYSMHPAIHSGRQLYMDLQEATEDEVDYIRWSLGNEGRCWLWIQNLDRAGIKLKDVKIPYKYDHKLSLFGPCSGVVVNEKTETTVPGLFAAGDTMGLSSGAGGFAVAYGIEAGIQSSIYVDNVEEIDIDESILKKNRDEILSQIDKFRNDTKGDTWQNAQARIQDIVNSFGALPLTDTRVRYALEKLREFRKTYTIYAADAHELARSFQVLSLLDAAEAIFVAAENRKEGFGPYKRVGKYSEWADYHKRTEPSHTVTYGLSRDENGEFHIHTHDFAGYNS